MTAAPVPLTFANVTVTRERSATPVRITVISLPADVGMPVATVADAPSTADAVPTDVIASLNWKTMECPVPINRDSTVTAPAMATPVVIGNENVPEEPCTFRDTTPTKDSGAITGVTVTVLDAGPVPNAFVALTEQVYRTPLDNPVTVIGDAFPLAAPEELLLMQFAA